MRLRQIALVASDLASAEAEVVSSLGVEVCFRDPSVGVFGLHNALFPIGDTFLEIVSPTEEGTTAGRLLDRRGGDGGYMVLLQVNDLDPVRSRLDRLDVRVVFVAEGRTITGLHLHPKDIGGAIVSIDRAEPPESWEWAGEDWAGHVRTDVVAEIAAAEIQSADPAATAARWAEVLDRPVGEDLTIRLDRGEVRFVADSDGRGPGVGAIDVVASDRARAGEQLTVVGTRVRLI